MKPADYATEAARRIREEPKSYDQHMWLTTHYSSGGYQEFANLSGLVQKNACGTTMCIAGHVAAIGFDPSAPDCDIRKGICEIAVERLGLKNDDLFFNSKWPRRYLDRFEAATTPEQRAEVASDLLLDGCNEDGSWSMPY